LTLCAGGTFVECEELLRIGAMGVLGIKVDVIVCIGVINEENVIYFSGCIFESLGYVNVIFGMVVNEV
jgi:hypothetical protein